MFFKKIVQINLVLLSSIFLCSCSSKKNLRDDFINYYNEQLKQEQLERQVYETSIGTKFIIGNLEKEKISDHPKVISMISMMKVGGKGNEVYEWTQLSIDERKTDLKECADLVINYAQNNNWDNDYYLYINLANIYGGCNIIYDYERDEIWIPNCENTFMKMYEKFNTFDKKELEKTQEGIDFLVNNNLVYIKHNQVEYRSILSYIVLIDKNGTFKDSGKDNSKKY